MFPFAACGDVNSVRDETETAPVLLGDAALKGAAVFQVRAHIPWQTCQLPHFFTLGNMAGDELSAVKMNVAL